MLVCALPIFHYLCTRKHQEQSSSDGLANRASSERRAKPAWALLIRERGRALAQFGGVTHSSLLEAILQPHSYGLFECGYSFDRTCQGLGCTMGKIQAYALQ